MPSPSALPGVKVTIRLNKADRDALRRLAIDQGESLQSIVVRSLNLYLRKHHKSELETKP